MLDEGDDVGADLFLACLPMTQLDVAKRCP